jgi:hypothetical protein
VRGFHNPEGSAQALASTVNIFGQPCLYCDRACPSISRSSSDRATEPCSTPSPAPNGRLAIRYRGLDLPYTTFDKLRQVSQANIVENKHLGAVLSHIREQQIERAEARSQSAPRRQGQVGHMFKVG